MSLRLMIGRAGTGKSRICMEEISRKQETEKGNFILIVPEQFSSQAEYDLIQKTRGKGILNAQVLSFGRLAHYVFAEKGLNKKTPLSDIGKSMTLKKILFDNEKELEYFKNSVDKQGFLEQLRLSISELFQYDISLNKLQILKENKELSVGLRRKFQDMYIIYKNYLEFLKSGYLSSDETLDILAEKLESSALMENTEFWLDGFYGFTPQEYKVITKLLKLSKRVTVTLTMDEKSYYSKKMTMSSLFFEPYLTAYKLNRIAEEEGIKREIPMFLEEVKRFHTPAMEYLQKKFFSYPIQSSLFTDGVHIYAAANQYGEIYYIANQILHLIHRKGWRYRDIAIVAKNLQDYDRILKGVLLEYQIPYFVDIKREILSHPLIELIRSAVDIITHNFSYESVFRYLKTGLTSVQREDADLLENYVLAYGIKGYKWNNGEWQYGFKEGEGEEEKKQKINEIKVEVEIPLKEFFEAVKRDKKYKISFLTEKLFQLIKNLPVEEKMKQWIEQMQKENNLAKAREHEQVWKIMVNVMEKMVAILGDEMVTIGDYAKILDAGLSESKMGIIPPSVDQIIVGDLERSRLPDVKVLFVLGINEGILPAPFDSYGVFSEVEREEMEQSGIQMTPNGKRKAFEEQYLIYCGITKPSHYLYFSYCTGDLEGKSMRPSGLIERMRKIFPNIKEEYEGMEDSFFHMVAAEPVFHQIGEKIRDYAETGKMEAVWKDAFSYYQSKEEWQSRLYFMLKGIKEQNKKEVLKNSTVRKLYGKKIPTSISKLEKYAACPFSYFVEYALKAQKRKLYQLNTPDLGTLFHKVLENFSQNLEERKLDWKELSKEQTYTLIDAAVEQAAPKLSNEILLETAANRYLMKRLKRVSRRAAWTLTEHMKNGSFEPYGYEVSFGQGDKLPPIVIELSNGERMVMRGKIDRVDILDKDQNRYIKIIDYKSGNKKFTLQDIYYGLQLQLILYLDAFLKYSQQDGKTLKPGGIFYFKVKDPIVKSVKEMTTEEIYDMLFKELKMSGLILDNEDVIQGLDKTFESEEEGKLAGGNSSIIPVAVNKNGTYKKGTQSVISEVSYEKLMQFAQKKAKEIGEKIVQGEIEISPFKNGDVIPCLYCDFHPICRFDETNNKFKYRYLRKIADEEFWKKIEQ